jgi:phenylpropionate dioxygenase-like ring-hydroxylating dioxygenase large terminal subunit
MGTINWQLRPPAHPPGALYQHMLDNDVRPAPANLRLQSRLKGGPIHVPADRYVSRAFHDLEVEKVWKRVWQMACREEEIPDVGDTIIYEIAHLRYIVVRTSPTEIKAFANVCRHRGRQLVDHPGCKHEFRCPFHSFTWNLDGTLKRVPSSWDFPQIEDHAEWGLIAAQTGTWGGFVFINPDPDAEPLETFLSGLDEHFARSPLDDRYISGHVVKILPTNWKAAQEAFMEAWHVASTHPQLIAQSGAPDSQFDVFGNFARAISPSEIPNALVDWSPSEQDMLNSLFDVGMDGTAPIVLAQDETARQKIAETSREALRGLLGDAADGYCDSEMVDSFYFNVFPNFHPWAGFVRYCFRFRPYGDDPDRSLMDVYILSQFTGERPPPAPVKVLSEDQDWTQGPEITVFLGRILNQDLFNMPAMQAGLKTLGSGTITFSDYQESKIRHFHMLLEQWTARP